MLRRAPGRPLIHVDLLAPYASSTVRVSSTIQAALRFLACGWGFESVHRALGLRRDPTGYS